MEAESIRFINLSYFALKAFTARSKSLPCSDDWDEERNNLKRKKKKKDQFKEFMSNFFFFFFF